MIVPIHRTPLTVMGGTNEGVTISWRADVADGAGHVVPGSSCTIVIVTASASLCETPAPRTAVLANGYVLHP